MARIFVWLTVAFDSVAFLGEAVLWRNPKVHTLVVAKLNPGMPTAPDEQAAVLRALFLNQGVYNLLLALGAVAGLVLLGRGHKTAGLTLLTYSCAFTLCAGLTLLATTQAYAGAAAQLGFPALALAFLYADRRAANAGVQPS